MPLSELTDTLSYPSTFDNETMENYISSPKGKRTLIAEWPHNKSVSAAFWDPRGRNIVSTSYDDNLRSESAASVPDYDQMLGVLWFIKHS